MWVWCLHPLYCFKLLANGINCLNVGFCKLNSILLFNLVCLRQYNILNCLRYQIKQVAKLPNVISLRLFLIYLVVVFDRFISTVVLLSRFFFVICTNPKNISLRVVVYTRRFIVWLPNWYIVIAILQRLHSN